ncbi:methyltransferase domain-containing protein [Streptomyces sp. SID8361]|uniref:class I SAM-dependent methyltransferase n=1 Tax=Streptomyces sp. MnatMP-M27 TaxID=1839768 RepID=UPI00081D3756|nr:class I SAM-dependent methyltransferase [Streptomyces sp. MnatMP-M27]MYU11816.1 methyltransferase domain-containing protein [Streptomyces sp. SID8361]SCF85288.1 Methyltransferase domain-containing protein [Streptomyces sp. MnatMP-M27]
MTTTSTASDWQQWQTSWDRQQEWYMPDREERFRVMIDAVEAVAGRTPLVLDLACGTGSISDRVLRRLPGARTVCVDIDPVLLTIARGHFAGDERVTFAEADLTDPDWTERLPVTSFDAVVTATALHWLETEPLRRLYGTLAGLLREGGVFLNADHMYDESAPRLNAAMNALLTKGQARQRREGALDWADWWSRVADAPALAEPAARRFALLGDPREPRPASTKPDRPTATSWHLDTLREQGFAEARQIWCSAGDALVAALR